MPELKVLLKARMGEYLQASAQEHFLSWGDNQLQTQITTIFVIETSNRRRKHNALGISGSCFNLTNHKHLSFKHFAML